MSSAPKTDRKPVTLTKLGEKKALGEPIVMVTAYDHPSALVVEEAGVDMVLVGDSAANNVLGYEDTVPVTVEELLMLARAVRRGLKTPFLVGDLPFGSYEASDEQAVLTAQRFVKEAGCDAVKLEGGGASVERARAIVRAGIPVMGHVGLTPQTATALGGYRAQGRTTERARADHAGRARPPGRGLLRGRLRGRAVRRHRPRHAAARRRRHRDRRRRRPRTARCSSCTTCCACTRATCRSSSASSPTSAARCCAACPPTPRPCASASSPGPSTPTRSRRRSSSGCAPSPPRRRNLTYDW